MVVDTKSIYTPTPTAPIDSAVTGMPLDVRDDFPIFAREFDGRPLIYLDSGATSQKPRR